MDTEPNFYSFTWESEEHKTKIAKGHLPAKLRWFEVVFQCNLKELPASEEVELSVRRVVYGEIANDTTVQDAKEDDADLY